MLMIWFAGMDKAPGRRNGIVWLILGLAASVWGGGGGDLARLANRSGLASGRRAVGPATKWRSGPAGGRLGAFVRLVKQGKPTAWCCSGYGELGGFAKIRLAGIVLR